MFYWQYLDTFQLSISVTFSSDIEIGKRWVSAQILTLLAKVLKVEIFELFKHEQNIRDDVPAVIVRYLNDVDDAVIKSIEEAVRLAVKRFLSEMHWYYSKGGRG